MAKYCLDTHTNDAPVIHDVNCPAYDLGTLLGLGCVADLGEFPTLALALEAIMRNHPNAVRCADCCQPRVAYLPAVRQRSAFPLSGNLH